MKLNPAIAVIVLVFGLSGCGTKPYYPQEYPLRAGLIQPLVLRGEVSVNNAQSSTDEAIVYSYAGVKLASNYKDITQLMVDQAKKELVKNTGDASSGKPKSINIKVTYLKSSYIAFYWKSELRYTATLGPVSIDKTVNHASGILIQDLNGCIAESVMNLLNDPSVIAYLRE